MSNTLNDVSVQQITNLCDNTIKQIFALYNDELYVNHILGDLFKQHHNMTKAAKTISTDIKLDDITNMECICIDSNQLYCPIPNTCPAHRLSPVDHYHNRRRKILKIKLLRQNIGIFYSQKTLFDRLLLIVQNHLIPMSSSEDRLDAYMKKISTLLTNVYQVIILLSENMDGIEEIRLAIFKLVREIQSIFPWFIEKISDNDNTRGPQNGHITENQSLAEMSCALKCYIDACDYQFEAIYIHDLCDYIFDQRESILFFIYFFPKTNHINKIY